MGTTTSRTHHPPIPRTVYLTHPPPHTTPLPGYVPENNHTLEYTLLTGHHTVRDLLELTQRFGSPDGPRVVGVRREDGGGGDTNGGVGEVLLMDVALVDGERLVVVAAGVS